MKRAGWWSSTGKEEPRVNNESCEALHVNEDGSFFFRNRKLSHRGTFYFGTWKETEKEDELPVIFNQSNLSLKTTTKMMEKGIIQFENGYATVFKQGKPLCDPIPYLVPISFAKSARKASGDD